MENKVIVPPIKSQGIKTKLIPWIRDSIGDTPIRRWVEPFMGTGVVGFNVPAASHLMCDANPHIINFYQAVKDGGVTPDTVREFLESEGSKLSESDGGYYYEVRERFNAFGNPLDFLFLNRSCFNGLMRFNMKGGFNVPFCKKPSRFSKAMVTKVCNQVRAVQDAIAEGDFTFVHQGFRETMAMAEEGDMVYADPPYLGRSADYFSRWDAGEDDALKASLLASGADFLMSSWLGNPRRTNWYTADWSDANGLYTSTAAHAYHVGAREGNRPNITELLIASFPLSGGGRKIKIPDGK